MAGIGCAVAVFAGANLLSPAFDSPPFYSNSSAATPEGVVLVSAGKSVRGELLNARTMRSAVALTPKELWQGYSAEEGTTWIVRAIAPGRMVAFARFARGNEVHWGAYECRGGLPRDEATTGCAPNLMLHHVTVKNLRQKGELRMSELSWRRPPVFIGTGLFWSGPRLLTFVQDSYRPSRSFLLTSVAALGHSWLLWAALVAIIIVTLTVATRLPRAVVHDVSLNLAIALWVAIAARLLLAILNDDFLYSVAWYSPVFGAAVFVTAMFGFRALRFR
jgi:hypothetical protein